MATTLLLIDTDFPNLESTGPKKGPAATLIVTVGMNVGGVIVGNEEKEGLLVGEGALVGPGAFVPPPPPEGLPPPGTEGLGLVVGVGALVGTGLLVGEGTLVGTN
jgi:hypothetical protein